MGGKLGAQLDLWLHLGQLVGQILDVAGGQGVRVVKGFQNIEFSVRCTRAACSEKMVELGKGRAREAICKFDIIQDGLIYRPWFGGESRANNKHYVPTHDRQTT